MSASVVPEPKISGRSKTVRFAVSVCRLGAPAGRGWSPAEATSVLRARKGVG